MKTEEDSRKDLSPLLYLNNLITPDFLVENKPKQKFGVNINLSYDNSLDNMPTNYPYGLGFKPIKFVSEIQYNEDKGFYDFTNREVEECDRKYSNIKYYMKKTLRKESKVEANYLAYHMAEKIWNDKFFYTMNLCPLLLKFMNDQTQFWKTEYNRIYDKRKEDEKKIY